VGSTGPEVATRNGPGAAAVAAGGALLIGGILAVSFNMRAAITSLPNAYAAVRLALRQNGAAVVSEAFNSNTLNLVAGIGVPALVVGSVTTVRGSATDLAWLVGLTVVALGLGYAQRGLSRAAGLLLIAGYLLFLTIQTPGR